MNLVQEVMDYISGYDPEVGKGLELELARQRRNLELIASENIVSPAVMLAMGTVPTNKYAEGYPGRRYYGGCEYVDELEILAIERAKKLFGAEHACVQPHSGAQANMAVYQALIQPGDVVMGMNLMEDTFPMVRRSISPENYIILYHIMSMRMDFLIMTRSGRLRGNVSRN